MNNRRKIIVALGASMLAAPFSIFAQQQPPKVARIGLLEAAAASISTNRREALIAGLRELGYIDGKNIVIEYRWAEGNYERLPGLAMELVQMKVDVIVAAAPPAIRAAKQATSSIPIVMVRTGDPVSNKFVASLSRPGGNITGLSNVNDEVMKKYLELLRAAIPKLSRVAVLVNPGNPGHSAFLKSLQETENANGVKTSQLQASTPSEVDAAFASIKQARIGALIVLPDSFYQEQTKRIVELAAKQHLPTMFSTPQSVESGALMSYGQNDLEQYHRVAAFVDKILKGAKPGDIPVEQPTKFELAVNMRTAKAFGLTMQALKFRADKVIE
jgi:putative tryptophan/tyrosine transport system substrate-binding protein